LNQIKRELASGDKYYYVKYLENGNEIQEFMTESDVEELIYSCTLDVLKTLSVEPVSELSTVALKISAKQCGKIPHKGDIISIYGKSDENATLISYGIIDSSYVILSSISYGESKSTSSSVNELGDEYSSSSSSSISYSLDNLPGILHATVIDRLDYYSIKNTFYIHYLL